MKIDFNKTIDDYYPDISNISDLHFLNNTLVILDNVSVGIFPNYIDFAMLIPFKFFVNSDQ